MRARPAACSGTRCELLPCGTGGQVVHAVRCRGAAGHNDNARQPAPDAGAPALRCPGFLTFMIPSRPVQVSMDSLKPTATFVCAESATGDSKKSSN